MSKSKTLLPVLALVLANLFWGVNIPVVKYGLKTIPVTIFISLKFMAASLILLPFAVKTWKPLRQRELGLMILSSIFWITGDTLATNIGLKYAPSINLAVIGLLGPLILCFLSVEFLKERMSLKAVAGALIAFGGTATIIGKPWEVSLSGQTVMLGNVLFFAGMLCGVISVLIAKPIMNKMSSYQSAFLYLFVGTLPIVPLSLTQLKGWSVHDVMTRGWVALGFSILAVTLANFFIMYGLKYKDAYSVGLFGYIQPVIIIIAAWFILGEHPSAKFALGAGLVFLGVYLAEVRLPHKLRAYRARGA